MKHKVILFSFAIMLVLSIVLSVQGNQSTCSGGGCDLVKSSEYAKTFGIYNAYYGVVIFSFMCILLLSHIKWPSRKQKILIRFAGVAGMLMALRFIYIQAFILNSYCTYCMIIDVLMVITTMIIFLWKE